MTEWLKEWRAKTVKLSVSPHHSCRQEATLTRAAARSRLRRTTTGIFAEICSSAHYFDGIYGIKKTKSLVWELTRLIHKTFTIKSWKKSVKTGFQEGRHWWDEVICARIRWSDWVGQSLRWLISDMRGLVTPPYLPGEDPYLPGEDAISAEGTSSQDSGTWDYHIANTLRYQIRVRVTDPSGGMSEREIRLGASITLSPLPGVSTQLSTHQKP